MSDSINKKRQEIDEISPSFCLAKWLQVTIDLVHGTTHSCHHPRRHHIPLAELAQNPSALHNTVFKKQQREKMLKGERPQECSYCWNIEDASSENISDRMIKNFDDWAYPRLQEVVGMNPMENINPSYLEVMLDNTCNFACSYCMADISTSIAAEIKKYGDYPIVRKDHRSHEYGPKRADPENPYIAAFMQWLPSIISDLKVFRLTGGEPLLSTHTFKILDEIRNYGHSSLLLGLNSNLCVPENRYHKFFEQIEVLLAEKKIKNIEVYASIDTDGPQAEFIRQGLDRKMFWQRLEDVAQRLPQSRVIIMGTFSSLSIPSFRELLERVLSLKKKYHNIILDFSYLKEPEYLRANLVNRELKERVASDYNFMSANLSEDHRTGYSAHEVNKVKRILSWMNKEMNEEEQRHSLLWRADFYSFINEYSRRYQKDFLEIFPEMKEFYIQCKQDRFARAFET